LHEIATNATLAREIALSLGNSLHEAGMKEKEK
jgi:hypothetical protein